MPSIGLGEDKATTAQWLLEFLINSKSHCAEIIQSFLQEPQDPCRESRESGQQSIQAQKQAAQQRKWNDNSHARLIYAEIKQ